MKTRTITIYKNEVHYDCEADAFKLMDVMSADVKTKNAIAADSSDMLDGRMLSRLTDLRDAMVRKRLAFCLATESHLESNDLPSSDSQYIYTLELADEFNDNMLNSVKTFIHEFLVRGTLYDWYSKCNVNPNPIRKDELDDLLNKIAGELRGKSWIKVPFQPFGPKKKNV